MPSAKLLFVILGVFFFPVCASQQYISHPETIVSGSSSYFINSDISSGNTILYFSDGIQNSTVICGNHALSAGYAVVFGNDTYNNTVTNCTIDGGILSLHGARNNLVNVSGDYRLEFADNSSDVGIGNYFHLLVYNGSAGFSVARFVQILPKGLADVAPQLISEALTKDQLVAEAARLNYTLPRFGVYYPTIYPENSSNGNTYYAVEGEEASMGGRRTFGPYIFYTPYIGYDSIAYVFFNATRGATFKPTYLRPLMPFYSIFPADKDVIYSFNITFHNHASYSRFELLDGWQNDPNATVMATFYNLTNGTLQYNAGRMGLGIHAFILLLDTNLEHENSTSVAYSVGISYCSDRMHKLTLPGYYPMAYSNLTEGYVFWTTNKRCGTGVEITGNSMTIDCRGGTINTTELGFHIMDSRNITIENCRVYGNGLEASYSGVDIRNTAFTANNASDFALNVTGAQIELNNVSMEGFYNPVLSNNSTIRNTTGAHRPATGATSQGRGATGNKEAIALVVAACAIGAAIFYVFMVRRHYLRNKR